MEDKNSTKNFAGLVAAGVTGTVALGLLAASVPFIQPAIRKICLPYVPATDKQLKNIIYLLNKRKGNVIDLGSGDGRIVLSAAKLGHLSFGVELNPWLVIYSRLKAMYLNLNRRTRFMRQDIWKTDLRNYDNIVIFGVGQMMLQLEQKLAAELSEESCVIACRFPLPNWKPLLTIDSGIDTVWLYTKPSIHLDAK